MSIWKKVGPTDSSTSTIISYQNSENSDPSSFLSEIKLIKYKDGGVSVVIRPNSLNQCQRDKTGKLQKALKGNEFILEFGTSNFKIKNQSDPSRIGKLFELIKSFEPIDEMTYQVMLQDIDFKRPAPSPTSIAIGGFLKRKSFLKQGYNSYNYDNSLSAATILESIQLHITSSERRDGASTHDMWVIGFPRNVENEQYRKMVEQLIQAGFSQNDSSSVKSNNQQQPSKIREFFEIIKRFEPIDEQTYKKMLQDIHADVKARTYFDDFIEKTEMLIAHGKAQEALNKVVKQNDALKKNPPNDWDDALWNLVKCFERENVEPSILIVLYKSYRDLPYAPHSEEAKVRLYALEAPLNETPSEKKARHEQKLMSAVSENNMLLTNLTFNELSGQAFSCHPLAKDMPELLMQAAETITTLKNELDELRELRAYRAKMEASELTAGLLAHGKFRGSPPASGSAEPEDLGSSELKGPTSMVTFEPPQLFMS
jgi:hypothetical protein